MKYFDHDTDAAKDSGVQALRLECGGAAVDAYWAIIESIYREETGLVLGENRPGTKALTHWLCTDWETFKSQFSTMAEIGLLEVSEDAETGEFSVTSRRAEENIASYRKKAETARQNGKNGGRPKGAKADGKPKRTKSVNPANPEKPSGGDKEKEKEKVLGTHKGYPNTVASSGAAAVEKPTAPPDAACPDCSSPLRFVPGSWDTADRWWCDGCRSMKEPA